MAGGIYLYSPIAGRSSFCHFSNARFAAPIIEFPAIKVIREALTLPEFLEVAVSEAF